MTTLEDAKKWLNDQEQVDAPQVADKRSIMAIDPPAGLAELPRTICPAPPEHGGLE